MVTISGVKLYGFSKAKPFGFIDICSEVVSGIYVIIQKNGIDSEIVKIGESGSVYSRFANYLSPFRTSREKDRNNRKTKLEFRNIMQEGIRNGSEYYYIIKEIADNTERKAFEKSLIKEYLSKNRKRPKMNNEKWIKKYLNDLDSKYCNKITNETPTKAKRNALRDTCV